MWARSSRRGVRKAAEQHNNSNQLHGFGRLRSRHGRLGGGSVRVVGVFEAPLTRLSEIESAEHEDKASIMKGRIYFPLQERRAAMVR